MPAIPGLRSPYAKIGRLVYFGRMLDKIRLHAAGQLPPDYVANLGDAMAHGTLAGVGLAYAAGVNFFDNAEAYAAGESEAIMGRVIRDAPADVISLKLGINLVNANSMTERTFGPAVHGLLDHVRDGHPSVPVLVVSPIFCPLVEQHVGPTIPQEGGGFAVVSASPFARPFDLTLVRIREMLKDSRVIGERWEQRFNAEKQKAAEIKAEIKKR